MASRSLGKYDALAPLCGPGERFESRSREDSQEVDLDYGFATPEAVRRYEKKYNITEPPPTRYMNHTLPGGHVYPPPDHIVHRCRRLERDPEAVQKHFDKLADGTAKSFYPPLTDEEDSDVDLVTKKIRQIDLYDKDTMPANVKEAYFKGKEKPNLFDYDAVVFDTEHVLAQYKTKEMTKFIVKTSLGYLHETFDGYTDEILNYKDKHLGSAMNCTVWDIQHGILLKCAEDGLVTHAYKGYKALSKEEIDDLYSDRTGYPPRFKWLKWPETSQQLELDVGNHWVFSGYFERCKIPVIQHLMDCYFRGMENADEDLIVEKSLRQVAFDMIELNYFSIIRFRENEVIPVEPSTGHLTQCMIARSLKKFVQPQPQLKFLFSRLRAAGKQVILLSNAIEPFLDEILTAAFGENWRSNFDCILTRVRKSLFFSIDHPFKQATPDTITAIRNPDDFQSSLKENKTFKEGNSKLLTHWLENVHQKRVKVCYFAQNYKEDVDQVRIFNQLLEVETKLKSQWDVILVMEELSKDPEHHGHDENRWGDYFFSEEKKKNYFVDRITKHVRYAVPSLAHLPKLTGQDKKISRTTGLGLIEKRDTLDLQEFSMDHPIIKDLVKSFKMSLHGDAAIRKPAEDFIQAAAKKKGFCPALLEISASPQHEEVQLAAAVQLGQKIEKDWEFYEHSCKAPDIQDDEKQYIRDRIIKRMLQVNNEKVLRQYERAIKAMSDDFVKGKWGNFQPHVLEVLQSQTARGALVGLMVLKAFAKQYKYMYGVRERRNVNPVFEKSFQIVGGIIDQLMGKNPQNSETALRIIVLICKVFNRANGTTLMEFLRVKDKLHPWMVFAQTLLNLPCPKELNSFTESNVDIERRDKTSFWLMRGQAAKLIQLTFSRLMNERLINKLDPELKKYLVGDCAKMLIKSSMNVMMSLQDKFVGSKCLMYTIQFLSAVTKNPDTCKNQMKPYIHQLLYQCSIPILKVTHMELTMFIDEPADFIVRQISLEDRYSPKGFMIELLQHLCGEYDSTKEEYKANKDMFMPADSKPDYLVPYLKYLEQGMDAYTKRRDPKEWRTKEALLLGLQCMWKILIKHDDLYENMEIMFQTHVLPELLSGEALLRHRACTMYNECESLNFKNRDHVRSTLIGLQKCIIDPHLAVKVEAGHALAQFVKQCFIGQEMLRPEIKQVLQVFLEVLNDFSSEHLVKGLQTFLQLYQVEVKPFICEIAQAMCTKFVQQFRETGYNTEQDPLQYQTGCALSAALTATKKIVELSSTDKALLGQLRVIVMPVVNIVVMVQHLHQGIHEYVDDIVGMITVLLYYEHDRGSKIHPDMWRLFSQLMKIIVGEPGDGDYSYVFFLLRQGTAAIKNFISRDPDTFKNGTDAITKRPYWELALDYTRRIFDMNNNGIDSFDRFDMLQGVQVILAMLENMECGEIMPKILDILLTNLDKDRKDSDVSAEIICQTLMAIVATFFNNAAASLAYLVKKNKVVEIFNVLFSHLHCYQKRSELRRVLFGLASLLNANLPDVLELEIGQIGKEIARLVIRVVSVRALKLEIMRCKVENAIEKIKNDDVQDHEAIDTMLADLEEDARRCKEVQDRLHDEEKKIDDEVEVDDFADVNEAEITSDESFENYDPDYVQLYESRLDEMDELIYLQDQMETLLKREGKLGKLFAYTGKEQIKKMQTAFEDAQYLMNREVYLHNKLVDIEDNPEATKRAEPKPGYERCPFKWAF